MSVIKPCPRCQAPLEIPQPVPEQIRCNGCGAIIKRKATAAAAVVGDSPSPRSPASPPDAAPQSKKFVLSIVAGVAVAAILILVVVLVVVNSGRKADQQVDDDLLAKLTASKGHPNIQPPPTGEPVKGDVSQPKAPEPPAMSPKVREAIDRGTGFLKKRLTQDTRFHVPLYEQFGDDSSIGVVALSGLALLEANVPADDPVVQRALGTVRAAGPSLRMVYSLGAALFFLNRLHEARPLGESDVALVKTLALRLLAGQMAEGRWTYSNPPISVTVERDMITKLRTNAYEPRNLNPSHPGSNSMTQFALLALWGSRRHDLPIRQAFLISARRFHLTQYPEGTWGYQRDDVAKMYCDSNTCAGLLALAMEKTLREDPQYRGGAVNDPPSNPKADEQCRKAFAHLGKVIGRTRDDPVASQHVGNVIRADAWGDYYFLWCLERVAVIYDLKTIEGKDWYAWGSEVILQNQLADGSWRDIHGDMADTCFAILFLTRANLARDLTESIRRRAKF